MRRARHSHALLLGLIALLSLPGAAPLRAVEPGVVLMTTSTIYTTQFGSTFIEAGFFDNNPTHRSDPVVAANIIYRGVPLETQPGTQSLGSADTVIELVDPVSFTGGQPQTKTIPIRLLGINLVSVVPLTVTYNGGTTAEHWNVRLCLSSVNQPTLLMQITNDCGTSGTFVANLALRPKLVLTRIPPDGRPPLTVDAGTAGYYSLVSNGSWVNRNVTAGEFLSVPTGARLDKDCDGVYETQVPATSDIVLGVARVGCNWLAPNQGYLALQPVVQAMYAGQVVQPTPTVPCDSPLPLDTRGRTPVCRELPDLP